ncbi:MAG TPA: carbamate kinase [Thermoplasmatales archaeon]|nr:carbamate kinase [Thermoplasmatales archaeon]HEX08549.1 carbamate kinase [Thermoplasmatales archaeon]
MSKKAVIALGGNALIKPSQKGTIYEQFANTREVSKILTKIIKEDWDIVLTHGNGPQVGSILIQNEMAKDITPPMPLGICVAESQGLIGYMIQQCLYNALRKEGIEKPVVTIITQVYVNKDDPAFKNPTKPIGPHYNEKRALELLRQGYPLIKEKKGWRILVPSPDPLGIVEADIIKRMIEEGIVVIAAGGGGLPVIEKENWGLDGLEAVVDKDLSAERLAEAINADLLFILTDVEKVYLDYGTEKQKPLDKIRLDEIRKYYTEGHFPPGSMGPKVLAAIRFLESGGKKVIISHIEKAWEALKEKTGTHIVP